jgi:hypothetical protein
VNTSVESNSRLKMFARNFGDALFPGSSGLEGGFRLAGTLSGIAGGSVFGRFVGSKLGERWTFIGSAVGLLMGWRVGEALGRAGAMTVRQARAEREHAEVISNWVDEGPRILPAWDVAPALGVTWPSKTANGLTEAAPRATPRAPRSR